MNPIRKFSKVSGKEPSVIEHGEIAINNHDGILMIRGENGKTVKIRERNIYYRVNTLAERNDLVLHNIMKNGDYVSYPDNGHTYSEVFFDYKWFLMQKDIVI